MILIVCLIIMVSCDRQSTKDKESVESTTEEYAGFTPEEQIKEKVRNIYDIVSNGEFGKLSLEIYCRDPNVYFYGWKNNIPGSLSDLYKTEQEQHAYDKEWLFLVTRYDVNGTELETNKKFLNKLTPDVVVPFQEKTIINDDTISGLDEYIYYIIKEDNEMILEVSMWGYITKERIPEEGDNSSITDRLAYVPFLVVNGMLVEDDYVFGKIIMPFLPYEYAVWIYNSYHA